MVGDDTESFRVKGVAERRWFERGRVNDLVSCNEGSLVVMWLRAKKGKVERVAW